jgi:hypothetical protein
MKNGVVLRLWAVRRAHAAHAVWLRTRCLLPFVVLHLLVLWVPAQVVAQPFTAVPTNLTGVESGSLAWGDYDNDGDLDIVLMGGFPGGDVSGTAEVYRNDGGGVFTMVAGMEPLGCSSVAWGDFDSDGDLDILVSGVIAIWVQTSRLALIYRNDGADTFTRLEVGFLQVGWSSVAWVDYDNDGDLDVFLTGHTGAKVTRLYRNDGGGTFSDAGIPFPDVFHGSVAWGDYDSDGDLDVLLTGEGTTELIAKLYRNEGGGVFTDVPTGFPGVCGSAVAWGDYDGDGDLDLVLSGESDSGSFSRVFRNDGGAFTETRAVLPAIVDGAVAWGDYDNDGDLDLAMTGKGLTKLYRNDGGDVLTDSAMPLLGLSSSSLAWGDYDNDGDLDLLIAGKGAKPSTALYRNDGTAVNTAPSAPTDLRASSGGGEVTLRWKPSSDVQTPSTALTYNLRVSTVPGGVNVVSPMSLSDTGKRLVPERGGLQHGTTAVLRSLPAGTYYWSVQAIDTAFAGSVFATESTFCVPPFAISPSVAHCPRNGCTGTITVTANESEAWSALSATPSWLTITGGMNSRGSGVVGYAVAPNPAEAGRKGSVLVAGQTFSISQDGAFTAMPGGLPILSWSTPAWCDIDNDGDLDFVALTWSDDEESTGIFRNGGNGEFVAVSPVFEGLTAHAAAWGDYDNDGDLDLLLTGSSWVKPGPFNRFTNLYKNDGRGGFTAAKAGLPAIEDGSVAWGDYDNDGDLDVLLTGLVKGGFASKVYRNERGVFTDINANLLGLGDGSAAWGDYDNDGDLDILLTGYWWGPPGVSIIEVVSKVYRNDRGVFADIGASVLGVSSGSGAWGDYDNDGDLDILLSGSGVPGVITRVYRNDGGGSFTDVDARLVPVAYSGSGALWGDYDCDGDLDILVTGCDATVHRNEGSVFSTTGVTLGDVPRTIATWADIDNDGDLDILIANGRSSKRQTGVFRNNTRVALEGAANTPPTVPTGLGAHTESDSVTLSWIAASDGETPTEGLTYNLRVGTEPGGVNIVSPMSSTSTGWRRVPGPGGAGRGTTAILTSLPPGTYYWSVQAIDSVFTASRFAPESTFTITISRPRRRL